KEVAKASIELQVDDIFNFIDKADSTKTSESVSAGGIEWQLRVESLTEEDGEIPKCFLRGSDKNGTWSRWVTADFFLFDQRDWRKLGGVSETIVGSTPLRAYTGQPRLVSEQRMQDGLYAYIDGYDDSAKFRVDFACWNDSFQEKRDVDDVTFIVEGRPVYANKGYITYVSPVLRGVLTGNFKEAQSDQVPITQTSAEDFVTLMRAVTPMREPLTDANVWTLYSLADVYDVDFLRRDCEKHLMATQGINATAKVLMAESLNKTDFITRLVDSLSQADLEQIERAVGGGQGPAARAEAHLGFRNQSVFPF
ncbi:BATH-38 protein, partial [Aphelenchoides avenae]